MAAAPPAPSNQRKNERFPYAERIRVTKPATQHGTATDIGLTGIGINVPQAIPEGTEVELELFGGSMFVKGTVRKAMPGIRGVRMGIEFMKEEPMALTRAKGARA
jgi:hypothetical protein